MQDFARLFRGEAATPLHRVCFSCQVGIKTAVLPSGHESAVTRAYPASQAGSPCEVGASACATRPAPDDAGFRSLSPEEFGNLA